MLSPSDRQARRMGVRHKMDYLTKQDTGINEFRYRPEFKQRRRRHNDLYAACYALYRSGKSLQYIAEVHYRGRFTRQTLHDVFKTRGYRLRIKQLRPSRTYKGRVFRQDSAGLYRSRKGGETIYLHRLIWEEQYGLIPSNFVVIFKDGDHENFTIGNLDCLHREQAKKLYNHGNQFGYKRFEGRGLFGARTNGNDRE